MNRIACLFVLLLATRASHAAPKIDAARIGVDCRDDFKKLCKDEPGASVLQCMERHRAQTSAACLAAIDAAKRGAPAAGAQRPASCKDDFVRVCKGVKSGELKTCLKERRKELSDVCRKMFDMAQQKPRTP